MALGFASFAFALDFAAFFAVAGRRRTVDLVEPFGAFFVAAGRRIFALALAFGDVSEAGGGLLAEPFWVSLALAGRRIALADAFADALAAVGLLMVAGMPAFFALGRHGGVWNGWRSSPWAEMATVIVAHIYT